MKGNNISVINIKWDNKVLIILASTLISLILFFCSYLRHQLYQSNYDLLIFDQWFWQISNGIEPISSITNWHAIADHAAWVLYIFAGLYKLSSTINWIFLSQATALSFTAIPLWMLSQELGLSKKNSWIVCIVWWLQPIVFNVNIADFHPEVWAMPALAASFLLSRRGNYLAWLASLIFVIGCRDGLILIVFGISIENLIRKRWKYALSASSLSIGWFLFIKYFLFPYYKEIGNGIGGASEGNIPNLAIFLTNPISELTKINYLSGLEYILLVSIAFLPFWKKVAIPILISGLPLITINFISANNAYRMLIHQYNIPLAVIGTISVIYSISIKPKEKIPFLKLLWVSICWFALAKPYFFTGPYLSRLKDLNHINQSVSKISDEYKVLTTSYIAPHLSHREKINFPRPSGRINHYLENYNFILLNPEDPGWGSNGEIQRGILKEANNRNWDCRQYNNSLEECRK